jgi:hypothetical protein
MTREELFSMADKSHLDVYGLGTNYAKFADALERFASLVASAEREACAKLLEDTADGARKVDPNGFVWQAIQKSAELIRARGRA